MARETKTTGSREEGAASGRKKVHASRNVFVLLTPRKVNDTVECDSAVSKINIFKTVLPIILGVQMSLNQEKKNRRNNCLKLHLFKLEKKTFENWKNIFFTLQCF